MGWVTVASPREYCQVQVHIQGRSTSSKEPLLPLPAWEQVIRTSLRTHLGLVGSARIDWKVCDWDEYSGVGTIAVRGSRHDGRDVGDRMDDLHLALALASDVAGAPGKIEVIARSPYLSGLVRRSQTPPFLREAGLCI
jgi:RNase P/RNase MRP subunit POP5